MSSSSASARDTLITSGRSARGVMTEIGPALALGAVLVLAWTLAASLVDALPTPFQTLQTIAEMAQSGQLWSIAWNTFAFMSVAAAVSALVGIPWGVASGAWRWLDRATSPYLSAARALPSGMWVPVLAVLVAGSWWAMGIVVALGALPTMVIATKQSVAAIPPLLLRAGRTFGAGRRDLMRRVIFPAALPGVLGGLELGWAMGFRALIAAEIFYGTVGGTGIGDVIQYSRTTGDLGPMLATIVVILTVGVVMERAVFGTVHERMRRKRGLVDA